MRIGRLAAFAAMMALASASTAHAQLAVPVTSANETVHHNFNTLATSGSALVSTVPIGIGFTEFGGAGNLFYTADDGSNPGADTRSYGTGTNVDRALGELTSSTVQPWIAALIRNDTGATIPTILVGYTGEEWRLDAADATSDRLDVEYSVDALSISSGTWTDVDALDFVTPNETGPGDKNGNLPANRTEFLEAIAVDLPDGENFWLRWVPTDIAGGDDGLAIDTLAITNVQPDEDHDGAPDGADNCETNANADQADLDGDGQGNACDTDDDADGTPDTSDNCPTANADQANIDGDGQGDICDVDDDADGVLDTNDDCPAQTGPVENRGCPATAPPAADFDGDGVADSTDNCPLQANAGQADRNGDGEGDACDADDDGDGVVDGSDQCPTEFGTIHGFGCVQAFPPPPDTSACDAAKAKLEKKKAKLEKLRKQDASKKKIDKAKKKVKKAKDAKKEACAG